MLVVVSTRKLGQEGFNLDKSRPGFDKYDTVDCYASRLLDWRYT